MLLFKHKASGLHVGCSYKVLYSFFVHHSDKFQFVTELYDPNHSYTIDFFLVRDPFERIKSLFIDKLRIGMDPASPQMCQKVMLQYFGLKDLLELRQISFESFCLNLPFFYKLDAHFYPQEFGYCPDRVKRVVKIESELPWLEKQLGVNFAEKNHPSPQGVKDELGFTLAAAISVQSLYAYDLKLFKYSRLFFGSNYEMNRSRFDSKSDDDAPQNDIDL